MMKLRGNARTSMWQSLFRDKPTEIDYINGEIVNIAKKNNLKAPINIKLVELIKEAEKIHDSISYKKIVRNLILNCVMGKKIYDNKITIHKIIRR